MPKSISKANYAYSILQKVCWTDVNGYYFDVDFFENLLYVGRNGNIPVKDNYLQDMINAREK